MKINIWHKFVLLLFLSVTLFLFAPTSDSSAAHSVGYSVTESTNISLEPALPSPFLTGPQKGEPIDIAKAYLHDNKDQFGLQQTDLTYVVQDYIPLTFQGEIVASHIWLNQTFNNIPVYNGVVGIHIAKDGSIIAAHSDFVPDLVSKAKAAGTTPAISAVEAVNSAANQLGLSVDQELSLTATREKDQLFVTKGNLADSDIPAYLSYQPQADGSLRLAWNITIDDAHSPDHWNLQVDAETGSILNSLNYTIYDDFGSHTSETTHSEWSIPQAINPTEKESKQLFVPEPGPAGPVPGSYSYSVYPLPYESPNHAPITPPADGRTVMTAVGDVRSSPFGWHDDDGVLGAEYTHTRGNNVHAYTDISNNNGPDNPPGGNGHPDGGAALTFNPPLNLNNAPNTYQDAAVVNLFYWNNIVHDVTYPYGFDEANGNFQMNNYGNGGAGGDYVFAEAQDGSGTNNANFSTPPDGGNGRMQMYIWDAPNPDIDGDFDAGIVAHEYGHGWSIRQAGGPGNSGCLNNNEQMGEGWGDYLGLILTIEPGDLGTDTRGIGTYALGEPTTGPGIRPTPYSTNFGVNPTTYSDLPGQAVPHGVGYVWATMVWEMTWELIKVHGVSDNIFMPTDPANLRGNHISLHLVNVGLQLQPCNPGFVDGRDAILAADQLLYNGANSCDIWEAFARRGLGENAAQGSSADINDGTEDFTVPLACAYIATTPPAYDICAGGTADFAVRAGSSLTPPVTLNATGNPGATTTTFATNPLNGPLPERTTLTIGNTGAVAFGTYPITVDGNGDPNTDTFNLNVYDAVPGSFTSLAPAQGVSRLSTAPTLSWNSALQAIDYSIDIATDPAFTNIVHSASGLGTTYNLPNGILDFDTVYYWRVQAHNSCGDSVFMETQDFRTMETTCVNEAPGSTGALADATCDFWCSIGIGGITPGVANFTLNVATAGPLVDIDVTNLNGTHSWIGDIYFELIKGAQTVEVMPNMCGDYNDFDITIDDNGSAVTCPATGPDTGPVQGTFNGGGGANALANFNGVESSGTWTLRITDIGPADTGNLNSWGLNVCHQRITAAETARDYSDLKASFGEAWHEDDGSGLSLGALWDADDAFAPGVDDASDDGVSIAANVVGGFLDVTIDASANGYVACWFDWDMDDMFANDAIEKAVAANVVAGSNLIAAAVPVTYDGTTDLSGLETRCRIYATEPTFMGIENPHGFYLGGEVEDYSFAPPTASCAAPADVLDLGVAPNASFVDLSWTTNGATLYEVHRDTTPYFSATGNGPTVISEPVASPFTDTIVGNSYGNAAINSFYYLIPENGCGAWANQSNHVGEFDFAIVPGA